MRDRRAGIGPRLVLGLALTALAVLVWAWWDGGREPLRPIEQPVPVPEGVQ